MNMLRYCTLLLSVLTLLHSNAGAQWQKQSGNTGEVLLGVSFPARDTGVIVGTSGLVLTTTNGGAAWVPQTSGTTKFLRDVFFPTVQTGVAVGESGLILRTTDRGAGWTERVSGTTQHLVHVHFAGPKHGMASGHVGTVLRTTDGGITWTPCSTGVSVELAGIVIIDSLYACAVGFGGTIIRTTDGGASWTKQSSPVSSDLRSVWFTDKNNGIICGIGGTVLRTTNGGSNWTVQPSGTVKDLYTVTFSSPMSGTIVGTGTILRSIDGGASWSAQTAGVSVDLYGVSFTDAANGWAVGQQGTILHTSVPVQHFIAVHDSLNPMVTDQFESGGGTWIDVNGDGFLDLFVANGNLSSVNNALYLNDTKGGFTAVRTGAIVSDGGSSIGATAGDYNADGWPDLFVTNRQNFGNFLYRGTGDTSMVKISSVPPVTDIANSNSSSWVDIDGDGDLDLFTVNFQGNNFLYRNSGPPGYGFVRIDTGAIVTDGSNFSIIGAWGDYNNDRRPDLFIGNAGTQNDLLFTNTGAGTFTTATLADGRASLGASWGDYDNDGDLDLFVANFLNQKSLLYRNAGPPDYALVRIDTGIVSNDAGNSVGSVWADVDNDGDLDLFVANDGQDNFLYLNSGPPSYAFTKVLTGAVVSDGGNSFGCAAADYDHDGDLDLFVANRLNQRNFLYRNAGNANHWITILLHGTVSNRSAIGAKVRVKARIGGAARWQMQEVAAQTGYNSQNLRLHFGLGDATIIDSLVIEWPSGRTEFYTGLPVDALRNLTEGNGPTIVSEAIGTVPASALLEQNYPNPFNPITTIRFIVPTATNGATVSVTLEVFSILGAKVATLISGSMTAGAHVVQWNGGSFASGWYLYRLTAGGTVSVKRMLLLR